MREKKTRTDFLDDEDRIPQNEYNGVIAALDELDTNEKNHYLRLPPSREIAKRAQEHNEHNRVARNRYAIAQERARAKHGHEPTTAEVISELIDMHRAARGKDPIELDPRLLESHAKWLESFIRVDEYQSQNRDLDEKGRFEQTRWEFGD